MVRVSAEVGSGAARFRVMVQAESIERALEIARSHNPDKECKVTFPPRSRSLLHRGARRWS